MRNRPCCKSKDQFSMSCSLKFAIYGKLLYAMRESAKLPQNSKPSKLKCVHISGKVFCQRKRFAGIQPDLDSVRHHDFNIAFAPFQAMPEVGDNLVAHSVGEDAHVVSSEAANVAHEGGVRHGGSVPVRCWRACLLG